MKMRAWQLLFLISLLAFAVVIAGCGDDDDDDDNDSAPVDDDTSDDDTSDDDDTGDDDTLDDDDDDTIDDDTGDDDTLDDDTGDDDTLDDDTGDDDTSVPEGCIEGEYDPYWGNLHAHTGYSDGELTPADAFEYARDEGGLDIQLITDHLEQLYLPWPTINKWNKCKDQADDYYVPGEYLADCGYEYGSGFILPLFLSTGHNNVFFAEDLMPMLQLDFHNFYDSLVECTECIGQFNHPLDDPFQHWNHYEYYEDVDERMNLMEMSGTDYPWESFFEALDAGWHVSPMYNQDNHGDDWGTKNDRRSGLYMAELTREEMYNTMLDRRTFMSYDKNASIKMMAQDVCWMGSILSGLDTVTLYVEAFDLDEGDTFTAIELYGPEATYLGQIDCTAKTICTGTFDDIAVTESTFFVAKAIQTDGDWLVAAPIWVTP
ncbi:MAG TPA: hypothetical protein PKW95_16490 [bacterium]|nr:hypothetical protein [bacterium]